jgi:hypothetical protein
MKANDIISIIFLALVCIIISGLVTKISPQILIVPTFALISVCLWIMYDFILLKRYKAKEKCMRKNIEKEISNRINQIDLDTTVDTVDNKVDKVGNKVDKLANDIDENYDSTNYTTQHDINSLIEKTLYEKDLGLNNKSTEDSHTSIIKDLPDLIGYNMINNKINEPIINNSPYSYVDVPRKKYDKEILTKQHVNEFDIDMYGGFTNFKELHPMMGSNADTRMANRMKYLAMQSKLSSDIRASYHKPQMQVYLEEELRESYEQRHWWENDALDDEF